MPVLVTVYRVPSFLAAMGNCKCVVAGAVTSRPDYARRRLTCLQHAASLLVDLPFIAMAAAVALTGPLPVYSIIGRFF